MAAFDFQSFRAELTGDGARPNLFQVQLALPAGGFATINSTIDETIKFTFFCRATQIPGDTMGFIQVPYFGRTIKVPGNRTFPEWTVTVINDEDFSVRNTMEAWMNGLNSHAGNIRAASAYTGVEYSSDGTIYQYSKLGPNNIIKQYQMVGAFPVDISPIDLNWSTNDILEEFSVTLAIQYWGSVGDGVTS